MNRATSRPTRPSPPTLVDLAGLSTEHIQQAQPEELRTFVSRLLPLLQEARTDAAHHKLQYQMLTIESTEALGRIQVEMDMAQRETDVLNTAADTVPHGHARTVPPSRHDHAGIRHVHVDVWHSMVNDIHALKSRNMQLEQLLTQHKRMVVQQESDIATLQDRISLYRERLRENRSHLTRYRHAAGFLESPYKSNSAQSTPCNAHSRHQPPFAALLHASDIISERDSSMPRTPRRNRAASNTPTPLTPQTTQPRLRPAYETPETQPSTHYLYAPQTAPPLRAPQFHPTLDSPSTSSKHYTSVRQN
jgi:hypothetical protein